MDVYEPDGKNDSKPTQTNIVGDLNNLILEGGELTELLKSNTFNTFLNLDFSTLNLEHLPNYDPLDPNEPVYYVYTVDITSGIEAVKSDMLDGSLS